MSHPSRVRVSGPLESIASGFAAELSRLGYTVNSAGLQMHLMAHVSRWLAGKGLDAHELCTAAVERFLSDRRSAGYTNYLTHKAMQPLVTYLRRLGVVPPPPTVVSQGPLEKVLERYKRYLMVERGVTAGTARGYIDSVRPFLRGRLSADGLDLGSLRAANVRAFVVARCPGQSPGTAKMTVAALRSLLGFLHVDGVIGQPLDWAVPSVVRRRLAGLPKGLQPADVRKLLASCDRRTKQGLRDFAILTMLVRLGLRAGEVAALQLDDVNWRAGTLLVRGKGNRAEQLPLPADVGEAVAAFLCHRRPGSTQGRTVFLRVRAPHLALGSGGVTNVVASAARRAGLGQVHAHRLRHTAATQMLGAGATLPEIGQLLRHRRVLTTAIYAKVDREALRTIALPWPGGAV